MILSTMRTSALAHRTHEDERCINSECPFPQPTPRRQLTQTRHIPDSVPHINSELRQLLLQALRKASLLVTCGHGSHGGVYTQTQGPRFETPSEIKWLGTHGDVVGMTCGHEATLAAELKVPYAMVCMVDNMANGMS